MVTLRSPEDPQFRAKVAESSARSLIIKDITDDVSSMPDFDGHEKIASVFEPVAGLRAFIAIHDRTRGPAMGGCRFWPYRNETEALTDVLRLSRGMTYKAAIAGVNVGGGKSVIMGDPRKEKKPELLHAFGHALNALEGQYYTGEDVGVSVGDVDTIAEITKYALGGSENGGGDPSPMTAYGVFTGLQSALKHRLRHQNLSTVTVAVQGLGKVGYDLSQRLHNAGAKLIVADINEDAVRKAVAAFGANVMDTDSIHTAEADIFAPCAMGAGLNDDTIPELNCTIIGGSANNQLLREEHGDLLRRHSILYAPDYVINGGGLISVAAELAPGGFQRDKVEAMTARIGDTLSEIFDRAGHSGQPTNIVANEMAAERIRPTH